MTPIEHFLIDIIQILFRDWIENTIVNIGRREAATDIFQPTLRNYFTNAGRWYFFTVEDAFLLGVAVKNYNVGRLGFFVWAQPKLCFDRHLHVFIYSASKTFSHHGKKLYSPVLIEKNPSRHRQRKLTDRGLKGKSPGGADRTFPHRHHANIIQGLNRQNNCQHKSWNSRDWYFPADIAQAFLQTLTYNIFSR